MLKKIKLLLILKENNIKIICYLYTNKIIEIEQKFLYSEFINKENVLNLNLVLKHFFNYLIKELDEEFIFEQFIKKSNIKIKFFDEFFYSIETKKLVLPEAEILNIEIIDNYLKNNTRKHKDTLKIFIEEIILNKRKLKKLVLDKSLNCENSLSQHVENIFLDILNNKEIDYLNIQFFSSLNNVKNLKINKKLTLNNIKTIKRSFNIEHNDNIIVNLEDVWEIEHNFFKSNKNIKKTSINFYDELFDINYSETFVKYIKKYTKETFLFRGGSYNMNILSNKNFNISEFSSLKNLILKNFINNSQTLKVSDCNNVLYSIYEIEFLNNHLIEKNIVKNLIFNNTNKVELYFNLGVLKIMKKFEINNNNYVILCIDLDELNYQNLKFLLFKGKNNKNIKLYFIVHSYKAVILVLNFIIDNYEFIRKNNIKIQLVNNIFNKDISHHIIYKINKITSKFLYKSLQQFKYNLKELYLKNFANQNIKIKKEEDIPYFLQKEFKNLFKKSSFYINNII